MQTDYRHATVTERRYVLNDGTVLMFDPVHEDRIEVTRVKSELTAIFSHESSHHEHHVMHAVRPAPENCQVTMPENVRNYWNAIPEWMKGSLQLVHGKLIREDVSVERFDEQKMVERIDQVAFEKFVANQCPPCPALVLGNHVLTGWTPTEIAAQEKLTQSRQETVQFLSAEHRWEWLAGLSGVAAIVLFWSDVMRHPLMNFCGWGLFAYSLFCFGGAANKWLRHWKWKS